MKISLMKEYKKVMILGLLLVIVTISGCTGGGGSGVRFAGGGGDALDLNIDTEGRTSFDSLEPFIITVEADNVGEFDAENVVARLQGYDGVTEVTGRLLSLEKPLNPSLLDRPDFERDVPGGVGDVDWDVKAPFISELSPDREVNLIGEVIYDYSSLASRQVVIATANEIEKLENRGEQITVASSTESINGPIALDIITDEPYVRMSGSSESFRLKLTIDNDGSGNLYDRYYTADPDRRFDHMRKVTLRVPVGLDVDVNNCDFVLIAGTGTNEEKVLIIDENNNRDKLRLVEGGVRRDLQCRLTAFSDLVAGFNTYTVEVVAEYTYLQGISKKIVIQGTEEEPLRLIVTSPTLTAPENWINNTNENIVFRLSYQGRPVTSNIPQSDITVMVGGVAAIVNTPGIYRPATSDFQVTVGVPDLGSATGSYDLNVDATFASITATDVEPSAASYCPNAAACP